MRKAPKTYQEFIKKYPQIARAYEDIASECRKAGSLNERERLLVKLGIALGSCREGSVHSQVRKALDAGMQPDELRHAVLLALPTLGFPSMMASMTWVNDLLEESSRRK